MIRFKETIAKQNQYISPVEQVCATMTGVMMASEISVQDWESVFLDNA